MGLLDQAKALVKPLTPEIAAIAQKQRTVDEYTNSSRPAAPVARPTPAPTPKNGPKYGSKPGEKRIDTSDMTKPLGSFKKGGKVKKTGLYKLHKDEQVFPAKKAKKVRAVGGFAKAMTKKK